VQGHQSLVSRPPLPEGGPIQADPISATSKAPEAGESQDEDDAKVSLEENSSTTSPPPAHSAEPSLDNKRKRVEELLSSSTSAPKNAAGEALMTHKYRGCIVVLSINKSVKPNEEQKVLTSGFDQGFTVNTSKRVFRGIW
jgi:hypothetical protein